MDGAMSERREIDESSAGVNRLQSQGEIDCRGRCPAAAFRMDDREHLSAGGFYSRYLPRRSQPNEGFQEIGSSGRAIDVFTDSATHGAHEQLGLSHGADDEECG